MSDIGDSLSQQYPEAIPSPADSARAMKIRAQLHQVATSQPDSPDGQRAARMIQQLDDKFSEHWFRPMKPSHETAVDTGIRHFADSVTFGGAGAVARKLSSAIPGYNEQDRRGDSPASLQRAEEHRGDVENPGAALAGEVAGAAVPVGGPGLVLKGASKIARVIRTGEEAGALARVAAGAGRGLVTNAIASPVNAGIRAAVSGDDMTARQRLEAAFGAAKQEATSPITYAAGAGLGALEGGAQAFRAGNTQTARDIRTVEDVAKGRVSPVGPSGGYYESPVLKGMHTDEDVGAVSRRAGDSIRSKLNAEFQAAGKQYGAEIEDARNSGALARQIDPGAVLQQAQQMMASPRFTQSTKSAIEREVINPLLDVMTTPHGSGSMRLEDFNAFKSKLGDLGNVPIGTDTTFQSRAFQDMANTARALRDRTAMGDIDRGYAQRMDRLEAAHEAMGLRDRTHTDMEDTVAARRVANFVARHGEDTKTAGMQNADVARVESQFPGLLTQEMAAPEMLRARQRMTPGLGGSGGLHERVGGLLHHNAEPVAVAAYQLARKAPAAMAPVDAVAKQLRDGMGTLFAAHDAGKAQNEARADALTGSAPRMFIDRVEGDKAVLLDEQGRESVVDASSLPRGAGEGQWLQGGKAVAAPPSDAAEIRKRLSRGDKGGRLAL